ncbi:MAG TPA: hypothetical protein P5081_01955 [Phycisphaerae bacterium]|nr:hypothetical protein [Phycisphaerae bacterium]HRW51619.1 hypothetical protein [Phycisphaerae bacterium]
MDALIPNRFLIKPELALFHFADAPPLNGDIAKWPDAAKLPALCELDNQKPFADIYAGWNDQGIYIGVSVRGRSVALSCDASQFWKGDNVRVMTDMRDTRNIRRATRFCQHFFLLPASDDSRRPVAGGAKVQRATEESPIASANDLVIGSKIRKDGYDLTALLAADALNGFDPDENPRIGLFIIVEDLELGQQSLSVGDDMNWHVDPSVWPTAMLRRS